MVLFSSSGLTDNWFCWKCSTPISLIILNCRKTKEILALSNKPPKGCSRKQCYDGTLWFFPPIEKRYWVRLITASSKQPAEIVLTFNSFALKFIRNWHIITDCSKIMRHNFAPSLRNINWAEHLFDISFMYLYYFLM